jgi:hypothetical protein
LVYNILNDFVSSKLFLLNFSGKPHISETNSRIISKEVYIISVIRTPLV